MSRACRSEGGGYDREGVGYRRVSTHEQTHSGLGLDAQQAAIEQASVRLGVALVTTFTDAGVSGGLPLERRPALLTALDALRKGSILLVAKRDRLGRNVLNVAMIERLVARKGARIVSAAGEGTGDDEPTSVMMRQIIDVFAQFERAIIRARTRAALAAKRHRGEIVGSVPLGWRLGADGQMEAHPDEQRALTVLRELRAAGYTLRATAAALNAQGFRTRRGGRWHHQYVANHEARPWAAYAVEPEVPDGV